MTAVSERNQQPHRVPFAACRPYRAEPALRVNAPERVSGSPRCRRYVMCMMTQADKAREFLALHRPGEPLLLPNPWDLGSARLLASLGFKALGHHEFRLRGDPRPQRRRRHQGRSADTRRSDRRGDGPARLGRPGERLRGRSCGRRADRRAGHRRSVWRADRWKISPGGRRTPSTPSRSRPNASPRRRRSRTRGPCSFVLTARAENYLHGRPDLADTIARLQAFARRAPTSLYAPGLREHRGHPPGRAGGRPPGQRAGHRRRPDRGRAGRGRRQPGLGRRRVRVRRPRRARRCRHWPARPRVPTASRRPAPLVVPPPAVPSADFPKRAVVHQHGRYPSSPRFRHTCGDTSDARSSRWSRSPRSITCRYTRSAPISANSAILAAISPGVPPSAFSLRSSGARPIAAARRRNSASSLPQHTVWATE